MAGLMTLLLPVLVGLLLVCSAHAQQQDVLEPKPLRVLSQNAYLFAVRFLQAVAARSSCFFR